MTWIRLADGWNRNPKMLQLSRDARLLFVDGLTYCCEQLTDGVIARTALSSISFGLHAIRLSNLIKELVDVGVWEPIVAQPTTRSTTPQLIGSCHVNRARVGRSTKQKEDPCTGWSVHDFLAYQPSRSAVETRREQEREKKAKWRAAQAACPPGTPPGTSPACPPGTPQGSPEGMSTGDSPPFPSRPVNRSRTHPNGCGESPAVDSTAHPPAPDLELESADPKPVKPKRQRKSKQEKPKTPCPEGWKPTEKHVAYGQKLGFDADRVAFEAEKFLARCERDGAEFVSWNGGFSTWLANAKTFDDRDRQRAGAPRINGNPAWIKQSTPDDKLNAGWAKIKKDREAQQ